MSGDRYYDRGEKMKVLAAVLIAGVLVIGCGGPATFKGPLGRVYSIQEYREAVKFDLDQLKRYLTTEEDKAIDVDLGMMGFHDFELNEEQTQKVMDMSDAQVGQWMKDHSF